MLNNVAAEKTTEVLGAIATMEDEWSLNQLVCYEHPLSDEVESKVVVEASGLS